MLTSKPIEVRESRTTAGMDRNCNGIELNNSHQVNNEMNIENSRITIRKAHNTPPSPSNIRVIIKKVASNIP